MRKSHWILVGFMLFNTACVVENAFPGWSALYASARDAVGGALECVAAVTDHWINRYGIYFPTYPEFEFIAWSEASLYLTLGLSRKWHDEYWPLVHAVHVVPDYAVTIDLDAL